MALAVNALVTLAELKDYIGLTGGARDSALEGIINRVSDEIEDYCDRNIITRTGNITEYHTMQADGKPVYTNDLRTLDWPILTVVSVNEDVSWPPSYPAGTLLTDGVGYMAIKPQGILRRIGSPLAGTAYMGPGTGPPLWLSGVWAVMTRSIKVVYTAGYTVDAVPGRIKNIALRYAALCWKEIERGQMGVSGASDAMGNFTRFSAAKLTDDMQDVLTTERNPTSWRSGERDA